VDRAIPRHVVSADNQLFIGPRTDSRHGQSMRGESRWRLSTNHQAAPITSLRLVTGILRESRRIRHAGARGAVGRGRAEGNRERRYVKREGEHIWLTHRRSK
jgi:hypothetical protein